MQRVKWFVILISLVCISNQTTWAAETTSDELEYFAVFMAGQKSGYGTHLRTVEADTVTTTEVVNLSINRGGTILSITVTETSIETITGQPLAFESVQNMGFMSMTVKGVKNDKGTFDITINTAGNTQQRTMDWPASALMAEGLYLKSKKEGLKEGTTYTAKIFTAMMLQAMDAEIQVGPTTHVDLLGRVVPLTEVTINLKLPSGAITQKTYVDKDFEAQKMIIPMMGIEVELVSCSREFALSENSVTDFLDQFILTSPVPIENMKTAQSITYHLVPKDQAKLQLPPNDNQTIRPDDKGGLFVTVKPLQPAKDVPFSYTGDDPVALEALQPTRFLQSDDKIIQDLARQAIGDTKDAAEAAHRIESFVHNYINAKDFSVGYASASEVAQSKQGDCSEHAVLTAAMCRAAGIPAQVVMGYVYCPQFLDRQDIFGGHAWTQVYIGDKWIGLDATRAPKGYTAAHIAQAAGNGNPEDFFNLISIMGQFAISEIQQEE